MNATLKLIAGFLMIVLLSQCEKDPDIVHWGYGVNFWLALLDDGVDTDGDGKISKSEAEAVITLDISGDNITELNGLSNFINLESFNCSGNENLSSLDVSQLPYLRSLQCGNCNLGSLDMSECDSLVYLDCSNNPLTNLDLSNNYMLSYLDCSWPFYTTSVLNTLDISNCSALETLICNNNSLTSLDVSICTSLKYLDCAYCLLIQMDVSKQSELTFLNCGGNKIVVLDLTDCTSLEILKCSYNSLSLLDVSNCALLSYLTCSGNDLTNLDISICNNLEYLYINDMEGLTKICISSIQIPYTTFQVGSTGSPNVYFTTDCI